MKNIQKQLEQKRDALFEKAFNYVKNEIIRCCDRDKLKFSTMYMFVIEEEKKDGITIDEHELKDLIYWYEDFFGLFPQVYYSIFSGWVDYSNYSKKVKELKNQLK